jgi:hypothetical protein
MFATIDGKSVYLCHIYEGSKAFLMDINTKEVYKYMGVFNTIMRDIIRLVYMIGKNKKLTIRLKLMETHTILITLSKLYVNLNDKPFGYYIKRENTIVYYHEDEDEVILFNPFKPTN